MYLDESYDDNDFESDSGSGTNGTKFQTINNVDDVQIPALLFLCNLDVVN
jgi:hypothetical protein